MASTHNSGKATSSPAQTTRPRHPRKRPAKRRRPVPQRRQSRSQPRANADPAWDVSSFNVAPVEGRARFHDFKLPAPLMHAIHDLGFEYCTPIQAEILPSTLAGKDASGRAQTGTGKTAAFLITVIDRLLNRPSTSERLIGKPRVLVLAPTRELVLQIAAEARQLAKYCDINTMAVFGGMDYVKQQRQLTSARTDIVIATPGRLLDFSRRRDISLGGVEVLIIDEADRMLDMGFIPDVRKIIHSTPPKHKRQTLLFSATLTQQITRLAAQWTHDPVTVEIEPEQIAVNSVEQIVYIVTLEEKFALLFNIIDRQALNRVLVFCNRRDEVRRLAEMLTRYGINCAELSGDIRQKKRIRRLEEFKAGKIRVLVATDVAGRGIHVEGMDHVINFTLPHDPENYVHRIGRTGRAGATGTSISFADEQESFYIPAIEAFIQHKLHCITPEESWLTLPEVPPNKQQRKARRKRRFKPRSRRRLR